jgi:glycerol-3-phosphate dehydrogenase
VWEALHERKTLTQIAPQLVHPIPFIIPVYKGDKRPLWLVRLGMFLYDLMAGLKNIKRHKAFSAKKLHQIEPHLGTKNLQGGGIYYDCQTNDARLTLANIQDAAAHGATVKNYTEVTKIHNHATGVEIEAQDTLTNEKQIYTAKFIVNVTGPWLDENLAKWHMENVDQTSKHEPSSPASAHHKKHLRLTKGIHFFVPKLTTDYAVLISAKKDNRVFFVIPHGKFSLVGTTDTDYTQDPDKVTATEDDIKYLLTELNRVFPNEPRTRKDVTGIYAGLRPLLNQENKKAGQVSREYHIETVTIGNAKLLNVIGGKLTTYRNLSQKVTDIIFHALSKTSPLCTTATKRLPGSAFAEKTLEEFMQTQLKKHSQLQTLPQDIAKNLLTTYGSEIDKVLPYLHPTSDAPHAHTPTARLIPTSPTIWAELSYCIDHEYVKTAEDFLCRRTELYKCLTEEQKAKVKSEITQRIA